VKGIKSIPDVPAKQFIGALPGKHHLYAVLVHRARQRQGCRVKCLFQRALTVEDHALKMGRDILTLNENRMMNGPEFFRHQALIAPLRKLCLEKIHGKGVPHFG